jgi:hypothetical protein
VSDSDHVTLDASALNETSQAAAAAAPSSPRGLFGRLASKPQGQTSSKSIKGFLGHYQPSIAKRGIDHSPSLDEYYDVDASHDDQLHHDSPFFVAQPAHSQHNLQTVQEKGECGGRCCWWW